MSAKPVMSVNAASITFSSSQFSDLETLIAERRQQLKPDPRGLKPEAETESETIHSSVPGEKRNRDEYQRDGSIVHVETTKIVLETTEVFVETAEKVEKATSKKKRRPNQEKKTQRSPHGSGFDGLGSLLAMLRKKGELAKVERCSTPPPQKAAIDLKFQSPEAGKSVALASKKNTPQHEKVVKDLKDSPMRKQRARALLHASEVIHSHLGMNKLFHASSHRAATKMASSSPHLAKALRRISQSYDECEHLPDEKGRIIPRPGSVVNIDHITTPTKRKRKIIGGHFLDTKYQIDWRILIANPDTHVLFGTQHPKVGEQGFKTFFPQSYSRKSESDKLKFLQEASIIARNNSHKLLKVSDGMVFEVFLEKEDAVTKTAFPFLQFENFEAGKEYKIQGLVLDYTSEDILKLVKGLLRTMSNPIAFVIDKEDGTTKVVFDLGPSFFRNVTYVIDTTNVTLTNRFPRIGFAIPKELLSDVPNIETLIAAARGK